MDDDDDSLLQHPARTQARLAVVEPAVRHGYARAAKDRGAVHEIEAVLAHVVSPLPLIPLEDHVAPPIVVTPRNYASQREHCASGLARSPGIRVVFVQKYAHARIDVDCLENLINDETFP